MNTLGKLTVDTFCTNCDAFVRGVPAGESRERCIECGCFASSDTVACARHELRRSPYPTGECPMCEEERRVRGMRAHEMTRDPTVEPW